MFIYHFIPYPILIVIVNQHYNHKMHFYCYPHIIPLSSIIPLINCYYCCWLMLINVDYPIIQLLSPLKSYSLVAPPLLVAADLISREAIALPIAARAAAPRRALATHLATNETAQTGHFTTETCDFTSKPWELRWVKWWKWLGRCINCILALIALLNGLIYSFSQGFASTCRKHAACWYKDSGKTSSMTLDAAVAEITWITVGIAGPPIVQPLTTIDLSPVTHLGTRPKMESGSMPCCCWTPEK